MQLRAKAAAVAVAAGLLACNTPTEPDSPPIIAAPAAVPVSAVAPALVALGTPVTVSDAGWQRTFTGSMPIEAGATAVYAVVFGGTGGNAPVTGVSVGGTALTRIHAATGTGLSIDVYRLLNPAAGPAQRIEVARSRTGYDPVRVTLLGVTGGNTATPNGTVVSTDITPATATAVKTLGIPSGDGALTLSFVAGSPRYLNGSGIAPASGYQSLVSTGEDVDGNFGVIGSAPGASTTTHAWQLRADQGGRYALAVSLSLMPGSGGQAPPPPPPSQPPVAGAATFGTVATFSDVGWNTTFGGPLQVEGDATVAYAVVFNGVGGNSPVSGVSLGGREFTRIKAAERTKDASLEVYRLVGPAAGTGSVAVRRSRTGYDPVRVSVFTVRGASTANPNSTVIESDLTAGTAAATRSVMIPSASDGLTISAVAASGTFANGNGVRATPGYQVTRASGEDADGTWGVLGSAPGAASVTHSWSLLADQAGRSAYMVTFSINGASGPPPPAPPPPPPPSLPVVGDGWTTVLDYDVSQVPANYPGNFQNWIAHERPWEQMLFSNLSLVQDASQPGTGSAGAARILFRPTLPGGYAPINLWWNGAWPANTGSLDLTFTIKLSANWDNNGPGNKNGGTKIVFFAKPRQNNHFISIGSRRYDGSEGGGTGSLGGAWLAVGLQGPTVSYLTDADLTRNVWHTVRVQVVANTPGVSNGQLRVWVDGQPVLINTGRNDPPAELQLNNVMFFSAGQIARQERIEFEPTYGGGTESPPYDQWMDIGHVTAAVR